MQALSYPKSLSYLLANCNEEIPYTTRRDGQRPQYEILVGCGVIEHYRVYTLIAALCCSPLYFCECNFWTVNMASLLFSIAVAWRILSALPRNASWETVLYSRILVVTPLSSPISAAIYCAVTSLFSRRFDALSRGVGCGWRLDKADIFISGCVSKRSGICQVVLTKGFVLLIRCFRDGSYNYGFLSQGLVFFWDTCFVVLIMYASISTVSLVAC